MKQRVDADGILRFALELGQEYANKCVSLTVASIGPPPDTSPLTDEERRKLIADLAGKWKGDFERPFQGEEVRVGANGLLTLPLGQANANKLVRVIVEGAALYRRDLDAPGHQGEELHSEETSNAEA